ncbi:TRAP transporter small permease subunit [Flavimaricola marinus]|uniref:TRAP transporter small permease protein n=1 Tax=Flavimaricola marinus TaxID=1819565 RepID=A0A238LJ96_9RHOB|nr:TRAP transporter small permease subunit [Flavimaricola marinus]SMY09682.1 Tripartite ATP-independent periplasmic transporters, DctQ component [Flavimaricola marinus]
MGLVEAWGGNAIGWLIAHIIEAFYNFGYALLHPAQWLNWGDKEALMRFIYYGASTELFFVFLVIFLIVFAVGVWRNSFLWGCVRAFEGFANAIGRFAAWAGLLMVLQQIVIIFMQRVFTVAEISFGFGKVVTFPLSWWSEELKLYNAMVVTLCIAWTFVQGGHVRVDLVYSKISFRAKRMVDMFGSLFFMLPAATLIWLYSWFFLWRNLVVPNPSASDTLDRLLAKSRALRWNVETIGFSPNGFNAYFLFKILLVVFTALLFLQAVSFFFRSYLEFREGEESDGKYLDRDVLGDPTADLAAKIH